MTSAVLLTCFNRKGKTRTCLQNLFAQELPKELALSVFLCDDGSSDGTAEMVTEEFPQVNLVQGNGNLYWGGGMNLAWSAAEKAADFDYYIWLNDDTFLDKSAFMSLFEEYQQLSSTAVLTAACRKPGTDEFSYGGWSDLGAIAPLGKPQEVKYINGNFVLIPQAIYKSIGKISEKYTHYLGDYDYGLRAQQAGFPCYTSSKYLASCATNEMPYWGDPELPLAKRWELAHSVKGLAIQEYIAYKKYHYGTGVAVKTWIDTYLKILFPNTYTKIRGRKSR